MSRIATLLRRVRRSSLMHNVAALYGVHIAGLLVPLVTVPYLARVLRPDGWGLVVFAQSFAAWLTLVLEYGFYLSATRTLARVRDDRDRVAEVVAGVQEAKLLLLVASTAAALAAYALVPPFQRNPEYLFWAWAVAAVHGFSPFWYFQGLERMKAPAALEVCGKVLATLGVFVFVRSPADGWMVLALQAGAGLVWVGITTAWLYREVRLMRVGVRNALGVLREAAALFVFRGATGAYNQANSFILGLLAAPQVVAFYGGAERIIRAAVSLVHPASQAIYPRMSHLVVNDREGAGRLIRGSLYLVGGLGAVLGLGAALLAPVIVRVLLGPGYEAAVPVLRVLALLPPLIAVGTVLGIQWALPMGMDRQFLRLVIAGGALNVLLALLLVPRLGSIGMAAAVVAAEACVAGGLLVLALRSGELLGRGRRRDTPLPEPVSMEL